MLTLPGYQLTEAIHEGVKTVIYRGIKLPSQTSVIIKTLLAEYPTLEEISRLRHEYKIIFSLNIQGIPKAIGLENYKNGLALILEDFQGGSIKKLISTQKISILAFLSIARQLAETLHELHQNHIIHKDIKPQNILITPQNWLVKLIDFSIASRLSRETPTISNPDLLEGTLIYMSPEQTGRMNRSLDYRTDFYSLGVTFYEILTGELPFKTNDPLELVHCHIAKTPVPPHQVNPEIPLAISEIVMKLMAKNAEDRYQSALGLKADIETCFNQLVLGGEILNFVPGEMDKSGQFLIPQKLYGREEEVTELLETFNRVAAGATEMMLVSGYSGIGKTSVVNEVHKPIVRQRGYFISGKFDQFKRNIPYSALIQALSELMRQLLTENQEKIAVWQLKLLEALGQNGQVIIDVIPEVEWIIGKQPEVVQLGPTESQNRFTGVFQKFISVFARKEHPLVLFLDDLQWADSASLKLIELIITDAASQFLLLIGAYRDNEVNPTHATIQTIEKIQQTGAVVNNIVLEALSLENILALVNDTLVETVSSSHLKKAKNTELARTRPLAELLFNKTQGNPFFLTTLLSTLYSDKLLTFDFTEGRWLWDLEQIQALGITDYNVVELVARNIQKLPETTQEVLKLAACIGNTFNLDNLAVVNEQSLLTTADELWEALQAGLILPLSSDYKIPLFVDELEQRYLQDKDLRVSYKFLHDRVQQAAYSLIPESERKVTHLKIGRLLLQKTAKFALAENIFDIVNQLNIGREFITKEAEQEELAKLNLMAGRKALAATAYDAAARYLNVGLQLLPPDSWERKYELTRDLFVETASAEYLNINLDRAKQLSDVVLERAKTLLEKVPVYETQIQFYIAQNQMQAAIDTALPILKMLGVSLPKNPSKLNILVGLIQTKIIFARKLIEELADLREMTDPYKLASMRILITVTPATFIAKPDLLPLVIFTLIKLSVNYGNSHLAAYAYGYYAFMLCGGLGDIDSGYRFGKLSLQVLSKFYAREIQPKVELLFNTGLKAWKEPFKETIKPLFEGIQTALEVGDLESACHNAMNYCSHLLIRGETLELVEQEQRKYTDVMLKLKQDFQLINTQIWFQFVLNLAGKSPDKYCLVGESFNERETLPLLIKNNNGISTFNVYFLKAWMLFLFKDYARSIEYARLAEKYLDKVSGMSAVTNHKLYYSLALLAHYSYVSKTDRKQYLFQVKLNQKALKKWAFHAPSNCQNKYELVEAEKSRILGQDVLAMKYYDRAIQGAKQQGFIQEEALANELASEFYFSRNREKVAQTYLTEAYYSYIRWGAKAKVQDLEQRYPGFFLKILKREDAGFNVTRTTTSTTGGSSSALDLVTVTKASQAISSEIVLDKLLSKLMQITIENVGASKGYLLLSKSGKLVLVAEGAVEKSKVRVLPSVPVESRPDLPLSIINYVERSQQTVVLNNATVEGLFTNDPYILKAQPKSIFCWPLTHKGKFTGILYLENNLSVGAFTPARLSVLKLLAAQAAISLENATLYEELQTYSQQLEAKNQELDNKNEALQKSEVQLKEKNEALEKYLHKLQQTQAQLVQTEKISSLGQLVASVAHEVNNPVSFINGNLHHASEYVQDLLNLLNLYQHHFPSPPAEIQAEIETMELEYIREDLPKMLSSMQVGTDKIREIMQSLRNFSRVDDGSARSVNIHDGLESTLMILQHRLKAKGELKAIRVVKEYGNLPKVECYNGQLNQVFMNILANAIDAMEKERVSNEKEIRIRTELENRPLIINEEESNYSSIPNYQFVIIRIKDNGPGMTEKVRTKLFNPFFTTKPICKGTGLGLSISYQIVVEKHGGKIECISAPGEGTEFVIMIPLRRETTKLLMQVNS
ncbi:serine/threonine protein kinase [[Phormidium ambiguum] IAM M-71]|uniref:histidine kinase n=1 Tax=[Phormidium ambiguum] IAM M-71 TaxID=454136 RepID=A0A1U7I6Q4_9CYAN|nr:ATP-binding sensor histidine kinase [Phormidium ambiguum]OKH31956.1 serine/threonine protein kinase [Phormidium ambiguum IAM M-71]